MEILGDTAHALEGRTWQLKCSGSVGVCIWVLCDNQNHKEDPRVEVKGGRAGYLPTNKDGDGDRSG